MTKVNGASFSALALLVLALLAPAGATAQTTTNEPALDAYEGLPLGFVANAGQTDERVRYLAQGAGYSFFFTDAGAVLAFAPAGDEAGSSGLALDLRFPGSRSDASPEPGRRTAGTVTRFTDGSGDPRTAATYRELTYRELWPTIDLVVSGEGGDLAYEFHLQPGADPGDIRLAYAGADGQSVGSDGDLVIHTPLGELTDTRPIAFQVLDGERVSVDGRHVLRTDGHRGIAIDGEYDRDRPLVIRSRLVYSTFLTLASRSGSRAQRGLPPGGPCCAPTGPAVLS